MLNETVLVFHGGFMHGDTGQIYYFTDNFMLADWYSKPKSCRGHGCPIWIGTLCLSGKPTVVDFCGQHIITKWETHAAHCNAHIDGEVLVALNAHDHGVEKPYPPELLATVYSTNDLNRFHPIVLV